MFCMHLTILNLKTLLSACIYWLVSIVLSYFDHILCMCLYYLGTLPTSTLLIGYYHGLLLRDTSADSLISDLYSNGLVTAQELSVILFGHSFHHRNWLLLEYVRHMNSNALLVFSELVKDLWPQIGTQLTTGV